MIAPPPAAEAPPSVSRTCRCGTTVQQDAALASRRGWHCLACGRHW